MFLDAWLKLAVFGLLAAGLLFCLFGGLLAAAGPLLLRRWRISLPLLGIATISIALHACREQPIRTVLIDLRKPNAQVLYDIRDACLVAAVRSECPSEVETIVVFKDGKRITMRPKHINWNVVEGRKIESISFHDMTSLRLPAARNLLQRSIAEFSDGSNAERLKQAEEWLSLSNDSAVYSEVRETPVSPRLVLVFRKNIDKVSVEYVVHPG